MRAIANRYDRIRNRTLFALFLVYAFVLFGGYNLVWTGLKWLAER